MSAEQKNYYLWLDESGDFEEDPHRKKTPPSLVGGVCCEESVFHRSDPRDILAQVAANPDFQAAFGGVPPVVSHCAELPPAVKVPARLQVIEWCVSQGMEFVFFQNRVKLSIGNSTRAYLNFLAEGLAQFMAHLSACGSAKLNVIIGRRVDTAALDRDGDKKVISQEEYLELVEERVAVAKARYLFDGMNQVTYEIRFASDKKNNYLVLSDYACSCKYTLGYTGGPTWQDYEEKTADGRTRRTVLNEIFETRGKVFGLLGDRLQHDVRRNLSNRDWGGALFLALSRGAPKRSLEDELCQVFLDFDAQDQRTQMTMFFQLVSHLLHARDGRGRTQNGSEEAVELLEAYLALLERLPIQVESLRSFCRVNAWLYLGTAYTHCGKTQQACELLEKCEAALPELLRQPENWNLYYILRNRQAVIWQDCYRNDKALEVLNEAVSAAELQQESQKQLFCLLNYPVEELPSEQQAKLLGSRALTYQYMLPAHPELAEKAQDAAWSAIKAFHFPKDKRRHYMTLAEINLRCGQLDEALQHFCVGLDCDRDGILEALDKCENPFDWYHAIRLADGLCQGSAQGRALAQKLFNLVQGRFSTVFKETYPAHSAFRRAGILCQKLGKGPEFARKCFQKCESLCFQHGEDTLYAIGLASLADRITVGLQNGDQRVETLEKQFHKRCTEAEAKTQLPELRRFYHKLTCESGASLDKKQKEKFYQSVSERVGQ